MAEGALRSGKGGGRESKAEILWESFLSRLGFSLDELDAETDWKNALKELNFSAIEQGVLLKRIKQRFRQAGTAKTKELEVSHDQADTPEKIKGKNVVEKNNVDGGGGGEKKRDKLCVPLVSPPTLWELLKAFFFLIVYSLSGLNSAENPGFLAIFLRPLVLFFVLCNMCLSLETMLICKRKGIPLWTRGIEWALQASLFGWGTRKRLLKTLHT
ncbi:hypothetical protein AAMO2058_001229100 [Amorphochlora amoebiformis]